jgi:ribosome-binding factor A
MSVIGTEKQRKGVMSLLRTRCPHLQFLLSRRVIMKYTPHLHFKLDEGIERGTRIINLMDELDLLPKNEEPGAEGSDQPTAPPLP